MQAERKSLPLIARAGAIAGLGLGTLGAIACGAQAEKNPQPTNTLVPTPTVTEVFTPTVEPDPTNTQEPEITLTPNQLQKLVSDSLINIVAVDQDTNTDIQVVKNELKSFVYNISDPVFEENPRHLINAIYNSLGHSGQLIAKLSCSNPNNQDLPQAFTQVKDYTMDLIDEYEYLAAEEGTTVEEIKRVINETFFTVPSDCPNEFLTASN